MMFTTIFLLSASALASPLADPSTTAEYQHLAVLHHNVHRANHTANDLTWNQGLADAAKSLASGCDYKHDNSAKWSGGGYGQNIEAGTDASHIGDAITGAWYNNEVNTYEPYYGQDNLSSDVFEKVGHFTQIVWADTTEVGCYTMDCSKASGGLQPFGPNGGVSPYFTVCNYGPPGNYGGQFGKEVHKSKGEASVSGSYTG